jgi:nitrogenase-associated protein
MANVIFYEKPGCAGNARQKALLASAGHQVIACNLLSEPWTADRLRAFFGARPVAEWFNRAAPRVKLGEIVPEQLDEAGALVLMLAEPLLIRRPLIQVDGQHQIGFDPQRIHAWIGLLWPSSDNTSGKDAPLRDWEHCSRRQAASPCGDGMGEAGNNGCDSN